MKKKSAKKNSVPPKPLPAKVEGKLKSLWQSYPEEYKALKTLCQKINYQFKNEELLLESLTHRSAVMNYQKDSLTTEEKKLLPWNERLEFLGDSVLGLVVSTRLWNREERWDEGKLSQIRSLLVCESQLASLAKGLGLDSCLIMGKGEAQAGGKQRESMLADAIEALLGAIYCDGGFSPARKVVEALYHDLLQTPLASRIQEDYKSQLQVLSQERFHKTPHYVTVGETGPDHAKEFEVAALVDDKPLAQGKGASKKRAAQEAAKEALKLIAAETEKTPE